MPVCRLVQNVAGRNLADRTRFVFDNDAPAFALPKRVSDNASSDVRRPACSADHDADCVGRIGLRDCGQRRSHGHHSERNCEPGKTNKLHFTLLELSPAPIAEWRPTCGDDPLRLPRRRAKSVRVAPGETPRSIRRNAAFHLGERWFPRCGMLVWRRHAMREGILPCRGRRQSEPWNAGCRFWTLCKRAPSPRCRTSIRQRVYPSLLCCESCLPWTRQVWSPGAWPTATIGSVPPLAWCESATGTIVLPRRPPPFSFVCARRSSGHRTCSCLLAITWRDGKRPGPAHRSCSRSRSQAWACG